MDTDYLLADKFAHQLLPQLCFVQTTQFFPNMWNSEPNRYAGLLWERLAGMFNVKTSADKIHGKKIDPKEGLTLFLVRFPAIHENTYPIEAAAVFTYRAAGVSFAIHDIYCFTLEKDNGRISCLRWEDSPDKYLCTNQKALADDSEKSFVDAIVSQVK